MNVNNIKPGQIINIKGEKYIKLKEPVIKSSVTFNEYIENSYKTYNAVHISTGKLVNIGETNVA